MLAEKIVRADRAARSFSGGVSAREFAAREFPREDVRWVASSTRPSPAPRRGLRARWGDFWRSFGTPGEAESDPEPIPDSAPA